MTMSNEKREQQMMAAADAYVEESEEIYNIVEAITDFCAGWRAADAHPQWIPVEEALPLPYCSNGSISNFVQTYNGYDVVKGYYDFMKNNWHNENGKVMEFDVTHWMPLPQPPQGKEDKV